MNKLLFAWLLVTGLYSCNNNSKKEEQEANESETSKMSYIKQLASPVDSVSAEPYLFTDKNGKVYLSWVEKGKEMSTLKFSVLDNDEWSEPLPISSGDHWFVNWADYPVIASDGADHLVAHFLEKTEKGADTYDVKLVISADKGLTWSKSIILNEDGKKAEHGFVSMVPYKDKYFVSWLDGRNAVSEDGGHEGHHGQMTLRGAIIDEKGNKSEEWELDNRVCDCCQTSTAITTNGPVVVYRDRSEKEIRDISIVRFVNGKWIFPQPIYSDNWKIDGCPVNGPSISALENNLAIAWFTSPDKNSQVNVVFSGDGGATFGAPVRIDEGKAIGRVDIVMMDEKSAIVSWMEGPTTKAVKVYSDGKKESSMNIAFSSEARSSGFPQMTRSGNNLIFAWTDDKEKTINTSILSFK